MNIPQLKWLVREEINKIKQNNPTPTKPKDKPEVHPGTPEKPKKRRPLTPPKESPQPGPKAMKEDCDCNKVNESEREILNKITQRFRSRKK